MNHRERVIAAINHIEPDRVPIDLWGSDTRLVNDFYFKLLKYLKLEGLGDKVRPGKSAEYVDYRISDIIDSDFRHVVIGKPKNFAAYTDENGIRYDEWGIGYKMKGAYPFIFHHPIADNDISSIKKYKGPFIEDPGRTEGLEAKVKDWYENTDYCITSTGPISGFIMEFYQYLRGTENFFTDLYLNVEFAHKLIEKITEIITKLYLFFLKPIAKYLTWVEFESDFGMQDRPFLSKEIFKKFLKTPMKSVFDEVKKAAPDCRIYLHSCGSIKELIPDFIDMGVEVLSSLQPLASHMDSFELKKEFGRDLVFHGGVDIQKALCGTVEDTIEDTKRAISGYGPGGGYICGPSNHFQVDVAPENFMALYETAIKFGKYPLLKK